MHLKNKWTLLHLIPPGQAGRLRISDTRIRVLVERYADIFVNSMLFYVRFQSAKLVQAASAKLKIAAS